MWRMAGLVLFLSCSMAMAEPVVLVSNDGYIAFSGDLIDFDKDFYVLETSVGEVKIPVKDVICRGAGCPINAAGSFDQAPPNLTLDEKDRLFRQFLEWNEKNAPSQDPNNELFIRFLEWRKNNAN